MIQQPVAKRGQVKVSDRTKSFEPIITCTPCAPLSCQLHPTATSGLRFFWGTACGLIESLSHRLPWRSYSKHTASPGRLSTKQHWSESVSQCLISKSPAQRISKDPTNRPSSHFYKCHGCLRGTVVTCSTGPSPRAEQRASLSPVTAGTTAVTMHARPLPPG